MNTETPFRLATFLILATVLTISISFRARAEREGGRLKTNEGQMLVVVLRLLGLLIVLPLFGYLINPEWVAWARFPLPVWLRWLAAAVALAIIPIVYWIFVSLGNNVSPTQVTRQGHQLVTHGPYRWVRHPLYSIGMVMAVALVLLTGLWWFGVALSLPLTILWFRTPIEEARLIETFGDEYREYMKRTGRFFPRLL